MTLLEILQDLFSLSGSYQVCRAPVEHPKGARFNGAQRGKNVRSVKLASKLLS